MTYNFLPFSTKWFPHMGLLFLWYRNSGLFFKHWSRLLLGNSALSWCVQIDHWVVMAGSAEYRNYISLLIFETWYVLQLLCSQIFQCRHKTCHILLKRVVLQNLFKCNWRHLYIFHPCRVLLKYRMCRYLHN